MPENTGYPDTVSRGEGAHPGDAANDSEDARKEWAGPGHAGRADDNKPIGPQSGFTPLMSSQEAHGNQNDETDYRHESGSGY